MATNLYTNNGWDLVIAITQQKLNTQLAKIHSLPIKTTKSFHLFGATITVQLDIILGAPQLSIRKGSGQLVDILFPISGTITSPDGVINIPQGETITVTTDLLQIEAELQPHKDKNMITFDFILDLESPSALVDMSLNIAPVDLAFLLKVLDQVVKQDIGKGKKYTITTFHLTNEQATAYKPFIPHLADFSFVEDPKNINRSNLLVLMQTVSTTPGRLFFNQPLLPPDQDCMMLMSNHLFLSSCILPPMVKNLQNQAKHPADVPGQIEVAMVNSQLELYQIHNKSNIPLNKDHDPWISSVRADVDTDMQAFRFYLDAQADVTFLEIHVDAWDQSWQQFTFDNVGNIRLKQIKEAKNNSTDMDWWKWLIAAIINIVTLVIVAIIYAIVQDNEPTLGGSFSTLSTNTVQWPNQKEIKLKQIIIPGHVVIFVDVEFQ